MSETVKKTAKKRIRGNPNLPIPGPGRPKGCRNKIPRTVKANIEEAFEKLGGVEGLVEWAKKNNRNRERLYDWYFSMLPKKADIEHSGRLYFELSEKFMPREEK